MRLGSPRTDNLGFKEVGNTVGLIALMTVGKFWLKYFSVSSYNSGNSARTEFVRAAVPCKVATNDEAVAHLKKVVAHVTEILDARAVNS